MTWKRHLTILAPTTTHIKMQLEILIFSHVVDEMRYKSKVEEPSIRYE
jgi:hypothetical protein